MKKFYLVNDSKHEVSLTSGLRSRIVSIKPVLTLAVLLIIGAWSVNAFGNTWTANVGVGSGKGSAVAKINSDALIGGGVQKTSDAATSTTTKQAKWSSISSLTKGHAIFEATADPGYTFDAWYTNTACTSGKATGNPYSTTSNKGGTYTYYAKFTPNEYTVTYDAKGGSVSPGSKKVTFDGTYGSLATPTKTGYAFAGWYTAASGGTQVTSSTKVTTASDHTIYAHWTANTYYVHFDGNGATSGSMSNQAFTYDKGQKLSPFANFERVYTVSYDANGGTMGETSETNTRAEYEFAGSWKGEDNKTYSPSIEVSNLTSTPNGTFTLYAQWNSDYVKLPSATRSGYVLKAWYNGTDSIGEAGASYTPTADVTLTAHWIDKYTPEFTFNKSESDRSMKVGDVLTSAFAFNHTSNPTVHISPEGVISYDATNNKVTAEGAGTATIYFTQAGTSTILPGESDHWTFTVTRVANTLALTSTSASKYVEEEVTGIIQTKNNSDATVQTSSSDATIAYYDVTNNKIVIPNSEAKSFTTKEVTITIWQAQTVKYEASGEKVFTLTVNKYPTSFSGSDYNMMVDGTQVANYAYTNTSAVQPTADSNDDFYYTVDEVTFTNSDKNKGNSLLMFDPSNKQITAKNAGSAKITLHQKETYKHTAAEKSFNVAVYKYNSVFATNTVNVKVEATNATSPYTLTYVKPDNSYISTESVTEGTPSLNSGEYYYTLTHNVTTSNTSGSSDATKAIEYVAGTKTVTGKNAGNATIQLHQTETYKFNAANASFNVNVTKNDPVFTWNNGSSTYYHNTQINSVCSSTNTDFAYTIGASTDAAVAREEGNTLYVLSKNGSANFTVSQAENYKWNSKEQTFTVTPANPTNHVTFTVSGSNYTTFVTSHSSNYAWNGSGIQLCDGGWGTKDDYAVIAFTGIPDKLTFDRTLGKSLGQLPGTYECHVYASADGSNWGDAIWTYNKREENASGNVQLPANARFIKFTYHGTVYCNYNNIKVTELKKFAANKGSLDFGEKEVNDEVSPMTFGLNYANAGHNITLTTNDDHFTVAPTTITSIGGEKEGTYTPITVTYSTAEEHTSNGAKLTIQDELGNKTTVNLSGKTAKRQPTITWSSNADYFNVDDELSATNANGLTVTLSSTGNESYVSCSGNSATMLEATTGKITITAHVAGNTIYADADFTKDITITNKEKQTITWNQDFSRLKTTDGSKSIVLNATASSGLPVSYALVGDKTGLTLNHSGDVWTLTYSATECKNTTIVASQGGNGTYAPASSVSKPVKVIDPTIVCDMNEVLVNSQVSIKAQNILSPASVTYNIDIPASMTVSFSRMKQGLLDAYLLGLDVVFYSGRNGTGDELYTKSYSADDINKSLTNSTIDLSSYIHAKSVKITTNATNGYYIDAISYKHQKYCKLSTNSLAFETYPNTQTTAKSFNVEYANYPILLECSNPKFSFTPTDGFGDCSEYGTQTISVTYTAGAAEGEDVGYLSIKDNTGATLKTCTLNVTISKVTQSITTYIQNSYNTTDRIELSAEANSGLTDFTYSASPAGVASFDGNVMTFSQSGTIAITVNQAGNNVYRPTSTTVQNVVVSKVTPDIATLPTGTSIVYNQTLNNSTLYGGAAETTFRGEANTPVEGTFVWTNPTQKITDNVGTHNYSVTFTPTDGNMYNTKEFYIPIEVTRTTQSIVMNNGSVKVAVDGIDAGAEDSYIVLDDLIQSQTSNAGSVSYAVISGNEGNVATIGVGNVFSATAVGTYTIRATKAQTDYYSEATADFTVTVGKRANTLTISGTAFEKYVDEEVTAVRSAQNSDAQVKTSSDFQTIAYYDVDNNKIVIPNSVSDVQMFGHQKTVTIKIWQEATDRFEASGEKTITLTVKKYETNITGTDCIVKVNGTKTVDYAFSHTSTSLPSSNLSAEFYYMIDEPNYENEALNNGTGLITYNPGAKVITGLNAGTTKITFFQKETRTYTGTSLICNIAVEKKENVISNTWNTWQKAMNESQSATVSFSSTRADYANAPISIERVYGDEVAALGGDASSATITTNTTKGYAIWHLSQAENYEYYAGEADLMVTVGVDAPPTCYVYEDYNVHEFMTHITDAEGHFETPIAINSPIDKIWYKAKKSKNGVNYFAVQYSTDNGKTWSTISSPDLGEEYGSYSATFPQMSSGKRITHVRFGAKTGATLSKWYKDVQISRKAYLNIQDAEQKNILSLPTMMCTIDETSTATAKFYIDYSTCASEILIQSSSPEHFTVSRTRIEIAANSDDYNSAKEEITVTYNSAELGKHSAVITISTSYQTRALSVSGETTKRTPTLTWQEGYTNNPLTLPIGLTVSAIKPAAVSTSTAAMQYASSNESVIEITDNGYGFRVVGLGDATLTAIVPENDKWKSVSDTRVIHATEKTVQEIVWEQSFPRFMKKDDVIDLDAEVYLRQLSTNTLTYSPERTANIMYSCPVNNVIAINGNKMTILEGYGEVRVTASVGGNSNYEAAVPVTMLINVRQPSEGCETQLVVNRTDIIDMFEVNVDFSDYFNLTTQEMVSEEIAIDPANGKPDKLSFSYEGEEFAIATLKFFGGFIKFEQCVNKQWIAVQGSRVETVKNEWNTLSNLQLVENATALRIIRESGATGHHKLKDIQVTRKQYLRATEETIDLGEIVKGEATTVNVGFEYSDIKGDLTARTINETTDVTIQNNGAIELACGSFGHYDLPVTFTPSAENENWEGTVEIYDNIANLSITVVLTAKVTVPDNEKFIFNKEGYWDDGGNWSNTQVPSGADVEIAQNVTIRSDANVKSITINEGVTVTVERDATLQLGDGDSECLGNLHVKDSAKVVVGTGAFKINDFILDAALGNTETGSSSGQVMDDKDKFSVEGDAYFQLALDPSGAATFGWYDFVVPFEVNVSSGIYLAATATEPMRKLTNGVDYAVMRYDEGLRASGEYDWKKFSDNMAPGRVYTIAVDYRHGWNTILFKKNKGAAIGGSNEFNAVCSEGESETKGWNGFGNGTLHHTQLNPLLNGFNPNVKVQLYDHTDNVYVPRTAGSFTYAVGTSFFMQVDAEKTIELSPATNDNPILAPAREGRYTDEFALTLTAENTEKVSDRLWVSASEEATGKYVIGHDLLKMGTPTEARVAQIWAKNEANRLCDIEMPLTNDKAKCELGIFAPQEASYTLSVEKAPKDAMLYLTYNGRPVWNLTYAPYTFDLTQGTTEGYGLQISVKDAPQVTTGVDNGQWTMDNGQCTKVIIDNKMYIITPQGAMFDATGKKIQ